MIHPAGRQESRCEKQASPPAGLTGWRGGEGRGEKDGGKRRRQGGKNVSSSSLAGIRGRAFQLADLSAEEGERKVRKW